MKLPLVFIVALFVSIQCPARHIVGCVVDSLGIPVDDATAIVSANDSIVAIQHSDAHGEIRFFSDHPGALILEVQAIGFDSSMVVLPGNVDNFTVVLLSTPGIVRLDELTVVSDRSTTVKRLANGNRFFLSSSARAMSDPFMALKEIPSIISDPSNSTVSMLDGKAPLVLVNGIEINSGIKPISPEDIEYVEVIDAVPARYLSRGVQAIINIQLRKNRPPYIWTELATRHEVPLRNGFGVWYFEVGNEKVSLYGRASVNYTTHDDSNGMVSQENTDYAQYYDWSTRTDGHSYLGELIFKYLPTSRDYLALELYERYNHSSDLTTRKGEFDSGIVMPYSMESHGLNRSGIFTSSVYYKHDFDSGTELEIVAGYNNNHNRLSCGSVESFGTSSYDNSLLYKNLRHSGNITVDFLRAYDNGNYLQIGSYTTLLSDRIAMHLQHLFRHANYAEYLYGGFSGSVRRLYYMISVGVQGTWLTAGSYNNHYIRPRISTSGTWQFSSSSSARVSYTMNNSAPDAAKLNPYNTSTDSLTVNRGNPALVPQSSNSVKLEFIFNRGNVYLSASGGANFFTDLIVPGGYTDPNGVYVNTYFNQGRYHNYVADADLSYRFGDSERFNGRVYAGLNYTRRYYTGYPATNNLSYYGGFAAWYRKFYFGADVSLSPLVYTDITVTRNLRPIVANVQVNYNITPNLYVAVCLQGFAGDLRTKVTTSNGTYRSEALSCFSESGLHPWILVRWNMRRNVKRKIKLGTVLQSTETGIQLR
ncbi:MAG: TonB-dependent receptor [Bacteroidales bacterium]|nr:TonB-dependent receptor [Bacteroidales bacterium]